MDTNNEKEILIENNSEVNEKFKMNTLKSSLSVLMLW